MLPKEGEDQTPQGESVLFLGFFGENGERSKGVLVSEE
jgi:hypothetical protein